MTVRIGTLKKRVEELGYDTYLVTDERDVRYLADIPAPQAPFLLVKHKQRQFHEGLQM